MENLKKTIVKELEFSMKVLKNLMTIQEYIKQISLILITEKASPNAIFLCGKLNQLLEDCIETD